MGFARDEKDELDRNKLRAKKVAYGVMSDISENEKDGIGRLGHLGRQADTASSCSTVESLSGNFINYNL